MRLYGVKPEEKIEPGFIFQQFYLDDKKENVFYKINNDLKDPAIMITISASFSTDTELQTSHFVSMQNFYQNF